MFVDSPFFVQVHVDREGSMNSLLELAYLLPQMEAAQIETEGVGMDPQAVLVVCQAGNVVEEEGISVEVEVVVEHLPDEDFRWREAGK